MRFDQLVRRALEQVAHDLAVQLVVFDIQDGLRVHAAARSRARRGISKIKVEPVPSSLSTQIRPPCISMNFLLMLRPRPVPPCSLAMVASLCLNSKNTESSWLGAIPIPVSATR